MYQKVGTTTTLDSVKPVKDKYELTKPALQHAADKGSFTTSPTVVTTPPASVTIRADCTSIGEIDLVTANLPLLMKHKHCGDPILTYIKAIEKERTRPTGLKKKELNNYFDAKYLSGQFEDYETKCGSRCEGILNTRPIILSDNMKQSELVDRLQFLKSIKEHFETVALIFSDMKTLQELTKCIKKLEQQQLWTQLSP
ncbi:unnamed protein product [Parnassius apollo]|uniref:(apollo) hypothetical protein n=1 Tax=Parnassius apollo TaxID=110799 RepID=A0A8S3XI19_PARAO|nr:unnamed protein product [Parnassius apollo]